MVVSLAMILLTSNPPQNGTISCLPVAPISPEAIRSAAVPVLSRYKTFSSHVNTANFRLRRFVDHFCSLVQPFTRTTFLFMTLNKAANYFISFYLFHLSTLSESTPNPLSDLVNPFTLCT